MRKYLRPESPHSIEATANLLGVSHPFIVDVVYSGLIFNVHQVKKYCLVDTKHMSLNKSVASCHPINYYFYLKSIINLKYRCFMRKIIFIQRYCFAILTNQGRRSSIFLRGGEVLTTSNFTLLYNGKINEIMLNNTKKGFFASTKNLLL